MAHEIREYLLNLPLAKHSPMHAKVDLADELSVLEGIIGKLRGFIRFLSKLNPMEYLRWMHEAFARAVSTYEEPSSDSHSTEMGMVLEASESVRPSKASVKKPAKAKKAVARLS